MSFENTAAISILPGEIAAHRPALVQAHKRGTSAGLESSKRDGTKDQAASAPACAGMMRIGMPLLDCETHRIYAPRTSGLTSRSRLSSCLANST